MKLELKYPCEWMYKIIGTDAGKLRIAANLVIKSEMISISESRESSKGKYVSLNVKTIVNSEDERKRYFTELGLHEDIKLVL